MRIFWRCSFSYFGSLVFRGPRLHARLWGQGSPIFILGVSVFDTTKNIWLDYGKKRLHVWAPPNINPSNSEHKKASQNEPFRTVAHNCHGKTKNLTAKTKYLTAKANTQGKTKAILLLLWSIWFCREVFFFCREVFGFAATVVGHHTFVYFCENRISNWSTINCEMVKHLFSIYLWNMYDIHWALLLRVLNKLLRLACSEGSRAKNFKSKL